VLDADTDAAVPWVATQYIPGPDLRAVVSKDFGPLPEHSVRVLANRLALALQAVHGAGLVHRDLKPTNILVTVDGPRVIDFGIARALDALEADVSEPVMTRTGMVVGSPGFMSPEQARGGDLTPASDVFCLGSVLTYAATGRGPFGANGSGGFAAQLFRVVENEPDVEGVPASLADLVRACLAKDPRHRPTPAEVIEQTVDMSAEPWLPGVVLQQMGRHAAGLLDYDPAVAIPAPPESAGAPAAAPVQTSTVPLVAPPEVASPPMPAQPPVPAALPRRRQRRTRMVIAAAVAAAVVVAGLLALKPWDGDGKNTAGGHGSSSGTGLPAGVTVPPDFGGAWWGLLEKKGVMTSDRPVRFDIQPGADSVTLRTVDAERYCAVESAALAVEKTTYEGTALTLSEPKLRQGNPASRQDGCTQQPTSTLRLTSADALSWELGEYTAHLSKLPEPADKQPIPDDFVGHWETVGPWGKKPEDGGFSRDGLLQLKTVDVEAGTVLNFTTVRVGVLAGKPGEAVQCFYSGSVFSVRNNHLFTTALVSGSAPGEVPACPESLPAQLYNVGPSVTGSGLTISVSSLGYQGVGGFVERAAP
jgi:hypothetical protein